jgi:hypothetical protein
MKHFTNSQYKRQATNGLAPSERHLEDYLWAHPEAFGIIEVPDYANGDCLEIELLYRQFPLPSGIVDLIGLAAGYQVAIIEIKKGPIDAKALAQLMRYMDDVKAAWEQLFLEYCQDQRENYKLLFRRDIVNGSVESQRTRGFIVGSELPDKNLFISAAACGIDFVVYEYDGVKYDLQIVPSWRPRILEMSDNAKSVLASPLGALLEDALVSHLKQEKRHCEHWGDDNEKRYFFGDNGGAS